MPQLTFFEKIEVLFGNIMDYPIFLILLTVPIIAYLIYKKLLKKGAVIIYLIASILVLIINHKLIPNLFDSLVDEIINLLMFPSMGLIFAVVIIELIILILTMLKNYRKVIKIINSISFVIIEIMFGVVLTLVVQNKIDFSKNQVLYNYLDVVTLMQLIMCTFAVQLLLLLVSKCIDQITLKLDGEIEEEIVIENENETILNEVINEYNLNKKYNLDKNKSKNIFTEKTNIFKSLPIIRFNIDREKSIGLKGRKAKKYNLDKIMSKNITSKYTLKLFNLDKETSKKLTDKYLLKLFNLDKELSKKLTDKYVLKLFSLDKERSLVINTKRDVLDIFNPFIKKEELIFEDNIVVPDIEEEVVEETTEEDVVETILPTPLKEELVFEENIVIPDIEEDEITEDIKENIEVDKKDEDVIKVEESTENVIETEEVPSVETKVVEKKHVKEEKNVEFNNDVLINEIKKAVSHRKPIPSPFIEGAVIPKETEEIIQKPKIEFIKVEPQKEVKTEIKTVIPAVKQEVKKIEPIEKMDLEDVKSINRSDVLKIAQKINEIEINSNKFINESTRKQMEAELLHYKKQLLKYKEEQEKKQNALRKQMEEFSSMFNITKDDLKY